MVYLHRAGHVDKMHKHKANNLIQLQVCVWKDEGYAEYTK